MRATGVLIAFVLASGAAWAEHHALDEPRPAGYDTLEGLRDKIQRCGEAIRAVLIRLERVENHYTREDHEALETELQELLVLVGLLTDHRRVVPEFACNMSAIISLHQPSRGGRAGDSFAFYRPRGMLHDWSRAVERTRTEVRERWELIQRAQSRRDRNKEGELILEIGLDLLIPLLERLGIELRDRPLDPEALIPFIDKHLPPRPAPPGGGNQPNQPQPDPGGTRERPRR